MGKLSGLALEIVCRKRYNELLNQSDRGEEAVNLELSNKQFRRLVDLAYIGNWILNSARGADRIREYDEVESFLFEECLKNGFIELAESHEGKAVPSNAFVSGGIHEAIMDYEDASFFDILAEELARRDLQTEGMDSDPEEVNRRIAEYIAEFERNGIENINVQMEF